MCEELESMIQPQPDLEIIGEAANAQETAKQCFLLEADVIPMDLRMSEMKGLEADRNQSLTGIPSMADEEMHVYPTFMKQLAAGIPEPTESVA